MAHKRCLRCVICTQCAHATGREVAGPTSKNIWCESSSAPQTCTKLWFNQMWNEENEKRVNPSAAHANGGACISLCVKGKPFDLDLYAFFAFSFIFLFDLMRYLSSDCISFPFDFLDFNICICCCAYSLSHSHSLVYLARCSPLCVWVYLLRDVVCNLCSHATVQMKESRFVTNLSCASLFFRFYFVSWRRSVFGVFAVCTVYGPDAVSMPLMRNAAKCLVAHVIISLKIQ